MLLFLFRFKVSKKENFSHMQKKQLQFFRGFARKISQFLGGNGKAFHGDNPYSECEERFVEL